jgi:hypothetical protein
MRKNKIQGMIVGEADTEVLLPEGGIIHIELKRPSISDGKGQSDKQIEYQKKLESLNHLYYLCNSTKSYLTALNSNLDKEYRQQAFEAYNGSYSKELVEKYYEME